jgi:hypothetical protein
MDGEDCDVMAHRPHVLSISSSKASVSCSSMYLYVYGMTFVFGNSAFTSFTRVAYSLSFCVAEQAVCVSYSSCSDSMADRSLTVYASCSVSYLEISLPLKLQHK